MQVNITEVWCCTNGKLYSVQVFAHWIRKFNVHAVMGLDSKDDKVVLNVDE